MVAPSVVLFSERMKKMYPKGRKENETRKIQKHSRDYQISLGKSICMPSGNLLFIAIRKVKPSNFLTSQ
jgi:hypothetical protein